MTNPITSAVVTTNSLDDYTAVASVAGLDANTQYYYELTVDGNVIDVDAPIGANRPSFETYPVDGTPLRFQVGFGGGAGYDKHERIWDVISTRQLSAFLLLGDNTYIDQPEKPAVQQYCYYRRQSRPEFRRMISSVPIFAIYDDHDFGDNDCVPGPDIEIPAWKRPVWNLFKDNWVNPYYGGGDPNPGCWFDFSIGDVDFFMLDCRYYRDLGSSPTSMLGPVQKQWLLDKLAASTATFKVIASSVPMTFDAKGTSLDTWNGFRQERGEIFDFITQNQIKGVYLISADRHRHDAWLIKHPGCYNFYEANTSRLANEAKHGTISDPNIIFSYNDKQGFGLLTFNTTLGDPEIRYDIITIDDELVETLVVKLSQLDFEFDLEDLKGMTGDWLKTGPVLYMEQPDPCVAHYAFDDGDPCTIAIDDSGNNYHGTLGAGPYDPNWVAGKVGDHALHFNLGEYHKNNNDYVDCGTQPGSANSLTVAFWLYVDNVADVNTLPKDYAIGKYPNDSSGVGWAIMARPNGDLRFRVGSKSNQTNVNTAGGQAYQYGTWTHIACTFENGTAKIYSDAELLVEKSAITRTVNDTATPLYMGTTFGHDPREAHLALDEVYIYDYALSRSEIMYLAGVGEIYLPLVSPYDLNADETVDFVDYEIFTDDDPD
jgi:alkaline phosphatase D